MSRQGFTFQFHSWQLVSYFLLSDHFGSQQLHYSSSTKTQTNILRLPPAPSGTQPHLLRLQLRPGTDSYRQNHLSAGTYLLRDRHRHLLLC
jgi:hypothetical protein